MVDIDDMSWVEHNNTTYYMKYVQFIHKKYGFIFKKLQ